jgi:uncharacterized protein with GYD domain
MPTYLFQGSYTAAAVAALVKKPEDRSIAVRALVESLGGKFEGFWLAFGAHDFYGVASFPDSQTTAAFALAVAAAGSVHDFQTTELLTGAEAAAAFKKAGSAKYRPPVPTAK